MSNHRLILFVLLAFLGLMLWQAWQVDYGPQPPSGPDDAGDTVVDTSVPADTPSADFAPVAPTDAAPGGGAMPAPAASAQSIRVTTDVLDLQISLQGGQIVYAALPEYPVDVDTPEVAFALLDANGASRFVHQGGLLTAAEARSPNHNALYASRASRYTLSPEQDALQVDLSWRGADGIEVLKTFRLRRGSYLVDVQYAVRNGSGTEWRGAEYQQMSRSDLKRRGFTSYSFTGIALSSPADRYEKFKFNKLRKRDIDRTISNGWAALIQHYFVAAMVPPRDADYRYESRVLEEERYLMRLISPPQSAPPGGTATFDSEVYLGPKLLNVLPDVAENLELTVDYGVFWILAMPLFIVLEWIHDIIGNWGWSIIALTVLLKIIFFPLSDKSYRSMASMRKLQPRMTAIRERYANDKQRMQQALMEMYKNEKINPLGGCLPMLIQIPVFIALYWVLLESVEMRQAPFALWLNDLSSPDPFFVLPLLMGISMYIQQKLNPAPPDPIQAKVMQMLPFVFTIFFAFFQSGLVLYWVVNNVLSISQQWVITRRIERGTSTA